MISIFQVPLFSGCQIGKVTNWLGVTEENEQGVRIGVNLVQGENMFIDTVRLLHSDGIIVQDSALFTSNGLDLYMPPPYSVSFGGGMSAVSSPELTAPQVIFFDYNTVSDTGNPYPLRYTKDTLNQSSGLMYNDAVFLLNIYEKVIEEGLPDRERSSLSLYSFDGSSFGYRHQSSTLLELGIIAENSSASIVGSSDAVYAYTSNSSQSPIFYRATVGPSRDTISIYGNYCISDATATRVAVAGNKIGSNFCIQYFVGNQARIVYGELAVDGQLLFGSAIPYKSDSADHKGGCAWIHQTMTAFSAVPSLSGFDIYFHVFDNFESEYMMIGSVECPAQTPAMCSTGSTAYLGYIGFDGAAYIAVLSSSTPGNIFWTHHTMQRE